jgi:hypothetical protein
VADGLFLRTLFFVEVLMLGSARCWKIGYALSLAVVIAVLARPAPSQAQRLPIAPLVMQSQQMMQPSIQQAQRMLMMAGTTTGMSMGGGMGGMGMGGMMMGGMSMGGMGMMGMGGMGMMGRMSMMGGMNMMGGGMGMGGMGMMGQMGMGGMMGFAGNKMGGFNGRKAL